MTTTSSPQSSGEGAARRSAGFSGPTLRAGGVAVGAAVFVAGGFVCGGWWWLPALAGVVGNIGSLSDRHLGHAVVLATLAMTAGVVAGEQAWFVPVLVGGVIASFELLAVADRITVVRPAVRLTGRTVGSVALAVGGSAVVLVIGALTTGTPLLAPVVAAVAATVALRVVAR